MYYLNQYNSAVFLIQSEKTIILSKTENVLKRLTKILRGLFSRMKE